MPTLFDDLDACDAALDDLFASRPNGASPPEELRRLAQADESTPHPDDAFLRSLRARIMTHPPQSASNKRSSGVGIIAAPYPLAPRVRLLQVAAAAALVFGIFTVNAGWSGDDHRLIGVPTAQAGATIERPTPTPTTTPHRTAVPVMSLDTDAG